MTSKDNDSESIRNSQGQNDNDYLSSILSNSGLTLNRVAKPKAVESKNNYSITPVKKNVEIPFSLPEGISLTAKKATTPIALPAGVVLTPRNSGRIETPPESAINRNIELPEGVSLLPRTGITLPAGVSLLPKSTIDVNNQKPDQARNAEKTVNESNSDLKTLESLGVSVVRRGPRTKIVKGSRPYPLPIPEIKSEPLDDTQVQEPSEAAQSTLPTTLSELPTLPQLSTTLPQSLPQRVPQTPPLDSSSDLAQDNENEFNQPLDFEEEPNLSDNDEIPVDAPIYASAVAPQPKKRRPRRNPYTKRRYNRNRKSISRNKKNISDSVNQDEPSTSHADFESLHEIDEPVKNRSKSRQSSVSNEESVDTNGNKKTRVRGPKSKRSKTYSEDADFSVQARPSVSDRKTRGKKINIEFESFSYDDDDEEEREKSEEPPEDSRRVTRGKRTNYSEDDFGEFPGFDPFDPFIKEEPDYLEAEENIELFNAIENELSEHEKNIFYESDLQAERSNHRTPLVNILRNEPVASDDPSLRLTLTREQLSELNLQNERDQSDSFGELNQPVLATENEPKRKKYRSAAAIAAAQQLIHFPSDEYFCTKCKRNFSKDTLYWRHIRLHVTNPNLRLTRLTPQEISIHTRSQYCPTKPTHSLKFTFKTNENHQFEIIHKQEPDQRGSGTDYIMDNYEDLNMDLEENGEKDLETLSKDVPNDGDGIMEADQDHGGENSCSNQADDNRSEEEDLQNCQDNALPDFADESMPEGSPKVECVDNEIKPLMDKEVKPTVPPPPATPAVQNQLPDPSDIIEIDSDDDNEPPTTNASTAVKLENVKNEQDKPDQGYIPGLRIRSLESVSQRGEEPTSNESSHSTSSNANIAQPSPTLRVRSVDDLTNHHQPNMQPPPPWPHPPTQPLMGTYPPEANTFAGYSVPNMPPYGSPFMPQQYPNQMYNPPTAGYSGTYTTYNQTTYVANKGDFNQPQTTASNNMMWLSSNNANGNASTSPQEDPLKLSDQDKEQDGSNNSLLKSFLNSNNVNAPLSNQDSAAEYVSLDRLVTCSVCSERFSDVNLLEDHKRTMNHYGMSPSPSQSQQHALPPNSQIPGGAVVPATLPGGNVPQQVQPQIRVHNVVVNNANAVMQQSGEQMPGVFPPPPQPMDQLAQQVSRMGPGPAPGPGPQPPPSGVQPYPPFNSPPPYPGPQPFRMPAPGQPNPSQFPPTSVAPPGPYPPNQPNAYPNNSQPPQNANSPVLVQNNTRPGVNPANLNSNMTNKPRPKGQAFANPTTLTQPPGPPRMMRGGMRGSLTRGRGAMMGPRSVMQQVRGGLNNAVRKRMVAGMDPKRKKLDILPNEDPDCHVISVQPTGDGPVINEVEGNVNNRTIRLNDSTVLKPVNKPKAVANPVADLLATRGITVTPTAKANNSSNSNAPGSISLNSSVTLIPAQRQRTVDLTSEDSLSVDKPYKCSICPKQFSSEDLYTQHVANHRALPFRCGFCPAQYPKEIDLINHRKSCALALRSNALQDMGLPVVDLRKNVTVQKLQNLGISHYLPVGKGNDGLYGIPIISMEGARNQSLLSLNSLGASNVLTLGSIKHINNR